jgi:hypothetical protein
MARPTAMGMEPHGRLGWERQVFRQTCSV